MAVSENDVGPAELDFGGTPAAPAELDFGGRAAEPRAPVAAHIDKYAAASALGGGHEIGTAAFNGDLKLGDDTSFYAVSPDGERVLLPGSKVGQAHYKGYKIESPDETRARIHHETYGGALGQTAAGLLAFARGGTFGLSDALATGNVLGHQFYEGPLDPRAAKDLEHENSKLSVAGEIGGTLLPAVLTAGGSLAARIGLKGAGEAGASIGAKTLPGLLSHATEGLAEHITESALAKFGEGRLARSAANFIGKGVGSAIEGAAYGAGHIVSEKALGDPEEVSAMVVAHMGAGALFGGLVGGALGGLGGAIFKGSSKLENAEFELIHNMPNEIIEGGEGTAARAVSEGAGEATAGARAVADDLGPITAGGADKGAADAAVDSLGETTTKFSPANPAANENTNRAVDTVHYLTGVPKEDLGELFAKGPAGERARALATGGQAARQDLTGTLNTELDKLSKSRDVVYDAITGQSKIKTMSHKMEGIDAGAIYEDTHAVFNEMDTKLDEMLSHKGIFSKPKILLTRDLMTETRKEIYGVMKNGALSEAEKASGIRTAMDKFKQRFGQQVYKPLKADSITMMSRETGEALGNVYREGPMRHLEDVKLYGGEVAGAQKDTNKIWNNLLTDNRFTESKLFIKTGTTSDGIRKVYRANPEAIKSVVDNLGLQSNSLNDSMLKSWIQKNLDLVDVAIKHHDLSPTQMEAALSFKKSVTKIRSTLTAAEETVRLQNAMAQLKASQKSTVGLGATMGAIGFALGGPVGGLIGGAAGLLAKPANTLIGLSTIERLMAKTGVHITNSIDDFLGNMASHSHPIAHLKEAAAHVTREQIREGLVKLTVSGEEAERATSHGAEHAAGTTSAATQKVRPAAIAHEAATIKLPQALRSSSTAVGEALYHHLGPTHREDRGETAPASKADLARAQYDRITRAVVNPSSVMQGVADHLHGVTGIAPNVSQQMQSLAGTALKYVYEKMPKNPNPPTLPGLAPKYIPTAAEIHAFDRTSKAVQDPLSVIDGLKDGNISQEGVDALKSVYPTLYNQVVKASMDALSRRDKPITYAKRIQMAMLLGQPLDPSLQPAYLKMIQGASAPQTPEPASPAQQGRRADMRTAGLKTTTLAEGRKSAAERVQESA